jgi:peptidoglycan/xylan/chitin deacetylase (PgdA/CDA1 family)
MSVWIWIKGFKALQNFNLPVAEIKIKNLVFPFILIVLMKYNMKKLMMGALGVLALLSGCSKPDTISGKTEITKWLDGKNGAISITWDDASINQFRQALPIMDTIGLKGTFFINTAHIQDSEIPAKYFGRPVAEIVKETASKPTDKSNLFERASALRFTGLKGAVELHNQAGVLYENEKYDEAYKWIDDAFSKVRKEKPTPKPMSRPSADQMVSWNDIKVFAKRGHEFASHTISHPRLSVLTEENLLYELEKCKEEIGNHLGPDHTFSAECPFGTENERVMQYAYKIHPALRNRMPEPFLEELNRASDLTPAVSKKEYVQWQRGPLTKTSMELMKSWVDTLLVRDNVWLVLTFHGVDGIGWEAKRHEEHKEYFTYMKDHEDKLWVATFRDVTKYMRERMAANINEKEKGDDRIVIELKHSLDATLYNHPLTLKTYVPSDWHGVSIQQGNKTLNARSSTDEKGSFVLYNASPNSDDIVLTHS